MKRITILLSSPRPNGNSDKLAWSFIKGAKAANHLVNIITIRDLRINGCLGCEYCYDHKGECIQNDDMQNVYNVLSETDIIVFATPIYYQSFPSQLKAVIDRLYVTENKSFPIEGSALLATYATPDKKMEEQRGKEIKDLMKEDGLLENDEDLFMEDEDKKILLDLTPETYLGNASDLISFI